MKYIFNFIVNFFIVIPILTIIFISILIFDKDVYQKNIFTCGKDAIKTL